MYAGNFDLPTREKVGQFFGRATESIAIPTEDTNRRSGSLLARSRVDADVADDEEEENDERSEE